MKIVSWNINGIRTFRNSLKDLLKELEGSIICLQETKASRYSLEEDLVIIPGYNSYFSSPRHLSGYSGVATFCLDSCRPEAAEEGLAGVFTDDRFKHDCVGCYPEFSGFESDEFTSLECEGRAILTKYNIRLGSEMKPLVIMNVYCPRMDPDRPERSKYKLQFYQLLQQRAENLVKSGCHVIIAGDINTSHKPIDTCHSVNVEEFCSAPSRQWMDSFLIQDFDSCLSVEDDNKMFVDTFRYFHPHKTEAYTCWMTVTGARKTNYGTRIDYIFADALLLPFIEEAAVLSDIEGSDHCPISVSLKGEIVPARKCPSICSKYWPEFSGKQQSLTSYIRSCSAGSESAAVKCNVRRSKQKSITNFFKRQTENVTTEASEAVPTNGNEKTSLRSTWKALLKGPPKPPLCSGHQEISLLRTVKKQGPNFGRQFFVCCRAEGRSNDPEARCDFFQWATQKKLKTFA